MTIFCPKFNAFELHSQLRFLFCLEYLRHSNLPANFCWYDSIYVWGRRAQGSHARKYHVNFDDITQDHSREGPNPWDIFIISLLWWFRPVNRAPIPYHQLKFYLLRSRRGRNTSPLSPWTIWLLFTPQTPSIRSLMLPSDILLGRVPSGWISQHSPRAIHHPWRDYNQSGWLSSHRLGQYPSIIWLITLLLYSNPPEYGRVRPHNYGQSPPQL